VVDFVQTWSKKTDIPLLEFITWLAVGKSKFYTWIKRYGKVNEHNALIPRDFWLQEWEKEAIIRFGIDNPLEGYRRLTFMMLDQNIVAVSPSSVWRVLSRAGLLEKWNKKPSKKGNGFVQPLRPHEHWHVDIAYLNIGGTFFYLCSLLDGCSRSIIHWEIREQMTETDVEIIIQKAKEKYPGTRPRIISDNGPQFIAKDFKEFIRISGMTHVRTSPYYPQSNGKLERFHKTLKGECIRVKTPLSLDDARRLVAEYIEYYNTVRLHSAIGYIAPVDKLNGRDKQIFKERDQKLEAAREQRRLRRLQVPEKFGFGGKSGGVFWNKVSGCSDEPYSGPFSQPLQI
jgi:transposase InsO family protein